MKHIEEHEAIVIIGGGPVGMITALALERHGIPSIIIEAGPDEDRTEWRGSTIHPPTLAIFDELGISEPILTQAVRLDHMVYRDLELDGTAAFDYDLLDGLTRFPHRYQFEQYKLVRLLKATLKERGVTTLFEHRVVDLQQDHSSATLTVETPNGRTTMKAHWVVAADGAHSIVRKIFELPFPGFTYPTQSLVVATPLKFEDYLPDVNPVTYWTGPQGRVSVIRTPDIWRVAISTQTGSDETYRRDAGDAPHPNFTAAMNLLLGGRVDPNEIELQQHQLYRSHQKLASTFRIGRILLAGDAAHLSSTTGGMGLNSGAHDASALAAAFAKSDVESALDAYATGRRSVAERFIQPLTTSSRQGTDLASLKERGKRLDELISLAANEDTAREHLINSSMLRVAGLN